MIPDRQMLLPVHFQDRDHAAASLLACATERARYVRSIPTADLEEAVVDVTMGLLRDFDAGVPLDELIGRIRHRLHFSGIGYYRKAQKRPLLTLDSAKSLSDETPAVEMLQSQSSSVEEIVLAHEKLAELSKPLRELEAYIAKADERLKIIHAQALQGRPRKAIAEDLTKAGIPTSAANAHQIVTRLKKRFPALAFLWEQNEV